VKDPIYPTYPTCRYFGGRVVKAIEKDKRLLMKAMLIAEKDLDKGNEILDLLIDRLERDSKRGLSASSFQQRQ
jgi:hypothetical protein